VFDLKCCFIGLVRHQKSRALIHPWSKKVRGVLHYQLCCWLVVLLCTVNCCQLPVLLTLAETMAQSVLLVVAQPPLNHCNQVTYIWLCLTFENSSLFHCGRFLIVISGTRSSSLIYRFKTCFLVLPCFWIVPLLKPVPTVDQVEWVQWTVIHTQCFKLLRFRNKFPFQLN